MRTSLSFCLGLALLHSAIEVTAQQGTTLALVPDKGLVFKRDTTFELLFRFRMQDRVAFTHNTGDDLENASASFLVRRFRLKLEGFALTPRLKYKVQLGLSANDQNVGDGSPPSPLLDAMVFYTVAPHTSVGFGQGKLPGGREALVSSGELELPERPLANGPFTTDRDFGLFADHSVHAGVQLVRLRAAICTRGRAEAPPLATWACITLAAWNGWHSELSVVRTAITWKATSCANPHRSSPSPQRSAPTAMLGAVWA
ncbi:MAG: hypothetical protein IPI95_08655 [Flavobacteriales bacterium]|nr:hypothetical protein [Flavobacteriales bacterium]